MFLTKRNQANVVEKVVIFLIKYQLLMKYHRFKINKKP